MRRRKNALIGALVWWFARRWLKRRAVLAVAGTSGGVAARQGRIGTVLGSVALVGALAAGLLFWRKRSGKADRDTYPSPARARPPEASSVTAPSPRDTPQAPAAA